MSYTTYSTHLLQQSQQKKIKEEMKHREEAKEQEEEKQNDGGDQQQSSRSNRSRPSSSSHPRPTRPQSSPLHRSPPSYLTPTQIVLPCAPRATIGKEERFSSCYAGMFIRAEAASELSCRDSPGAIYSPTFATLPRAQTVSWGRKPESGESSKRFYNPATQSLSIGPAAYHPRTDKILNNAPRAAFGKSDRFMSFGSGYALNNSPLSSEAVGPIVNIAPVRPRSASYSFSGGAKQPPLSSDTTVRSRPRTAFLTHSIRGGLARPATFEAGLGPAEYDTDQQSIGKNMKSEKKNKFGTATRFARPGLLFFSSEHAKADGNVFSPGPKYAPQVNSMTFKPRQPTTAMRWCP